MDPERIGRYRVERMLGSGSFATVLLAHDEDLDSRVAIKILADNWSRDEDVRRRFLGEARAMRLIDSDRIVRVYDVGELDDGRPYMVTEYADRGSLAERMTARRSAGEPYAIDEALSIATDLAECLIAAHDYRIIHRDLKPSNVLFRSIPQSQQEAAAREGRRVKAERMLLADFGIARRLEEGAAGRTMVVGTPHYMAPEQAEPDTASTADERADLYSAAVVFYELLAGAVPYPYDSIVSVIRAAHEQGPPSIRSVRPEVPAAIETAILSALAVNPALRTPSARAWRDALRAAASGQATAPIPPVTPIPHVPTGQETVTDLTPPIVAPTAGLLAGTTPPTDSSLPLPTSPAAASMPPAASTPASPPPHSPSGPPPGSTPAPQPSPPRREGRRVPVKALAFILVLGIGGGIGIGFFATRSAQAAEVLLEPVSTVGPDPFLGASDDASPEPSPDATETTPVTRPSVSPTPDRAPAIRVAVAGVSTALYGGTGDISVCDKQKLIDFLQRNAAKGAAWARVHGIDTEAIGSYVAGLKRLVINIDTRVTNHGFKNALATARQSLLQKGTAVLVDALGIPRVRCKCGNPLLAAKKAASKPKYVGQAWKEFSPARVVAAPAQLATSGPTSKASPDPTRTISVRELPSNPEGAYNGFARFVTCPEAGDSGTIPFVVTADVSGSRLTLTFSTSDGDPESVVVTIYSTLEFKGRYSSGGSSGVLSGKFVGNRILDGVVSIDGSSCVIAWSGTKK